MISFQESVLKRKQELAELLDEHETILNEIATMENSPGNDNENTPPCNTVPNGK